jgi:fibrillarin-like pre-rRNA processing protein
MGASKHAIRPTRWVGVFSDGDLLFTQNMVPGVRVYGERLFDHEGVEYREWVPSRSKLAAYMKKGGAHCPIGRRSKVLYLGAASGTTSSHVSDIVLEGSVFCVEISQRSFRDLVTVCESRPNMVPILGDATRPDDLRFVVEGPDVLYQDVAQKDQAGIFLRNLDAFGIGQGMLVVKARSEDVTKEPRDLFRSVETQLLKAGFKVLEVVDLEPYEKDHAMVVVQRA